MRRLKVVADAGNGMAGYMVPRVFEGLPLDLVPLFF
jgi:phosphomannomutase